MEDFSTKAVGVCEMSRATSELRPHCRLGAWGDVFHISQGISFKDWSFNNYTFLTILTALQSSWGAVFH